jgi:hypothetical protein
MYWAETELRGILSNAAFDFYAEIGYGPKDLVRMGETVSLDGRPLSVAYAAAPNPDKMIRS